MSPLFADITPLFIILRWSTAHCRHPFTSSTSNKEASNLSNAYTMMPAERSLAASSRIPVVSGVGCNLPSLSLLSSSSCCDHRSRPSPVSTWRGPQTGPSTCLLSPLSSMSPSPPSSRRWSQDSASVSAYIMSCSSSPTSSSSPSLSPPPPCCQRQRNDVSSSQTSSPASRPTSHTVLALGYVALIIDVDNEMVKLTMVNY